MTSILSFTEERTLARQMKQGSQTARNQMIESALPLVSKLAKRFRFAAQKAGMEQSDLEQEGALGLLRCAEHFDPDKNVRFANFASCCIWRAMQRALKHQNLICIPEDVITLAEKATLMKAGIEVTSGRPASLEEIALALDKPVAKIKHALLECPMMVEMDVA